MRLLGVSFRLEIGGEYPASEEALLPLLREREIPVEQGDRVTVSIKVTPCDAGKYTRTRRAK